MEAYVRNSLQIVHEQLRADFIANNRQDIEISRLMRDVGLLKQYLEVEECHEPEKTYLKKKVPHVT